MGNGFQPQKQRSMPDSRHLCQESQASGTGPAGRLSMNQHYSRYGGPIRGNAATGAFADYPRNPDGTHPPSPLPCGVREGEEISDHVTQGSSFLATAGLWVTISSRLKTGKRTGAQNAALRVGEPGLGGRQHLTVTTGGLTHGCPSVRLRN